jgi:hypothetical protein
MTNPVKCILIPIEPRSVVIKRTLCRVALWILAVLYIAGLHLVAVGHVSWVLADMKERATRERLIKESVYVVQGKYTRGFVYREVRE